jgi:hypothetical protein
LKCREAEVVSLILDGCSLSIREEDENERFIAELLNVAAERGQISTACGAKGAPCGDRAT